MSSDADLSTIEYLLLAQAVYEYGADAWQSVSRVLSKHPALARPPPFFSPQFCHQTYVRLMSEASLECSEANNAPHAILNLRLAQRHYSARLLHLRDLIAAEEARFKFLVAEIDDIRGGAWDDKIRATLASSNNHDVTGSHSPAVLVLEPEKSAIASPDDQKTPTQAPEDDTADVTQQLPATLTLDTPVDTQIAEVAPVTEDVIPEPAPEPAPAPTPEDAADITEEPTTADTPEESKTVPETVQMDVEEFAVPLEPEESEMSQQREEGKRKFTDSENLDENLREKKRARDESAPPGADDQAYPSRQRGTASGELPSHQQTPPSVPNKRFQAVIGMLHSQISQHRNGNIFHNPIKNSEAPDYHDIIKRPMDLKTIKARVKDGVISNSLEFQRDVYLMFANAMMYNRPGSDIYHMAEEMMLESEVHINTFRQTEGFIRSTRS